MLWATSRAFDVELLESIERLQPGSGEFVVNGLDKDALHVL